MSRLINDIFYHDLIDKKYNILIYINETEFEDILNCLLFN